MKNLFEYLYNFFFNRWTSSIIEKGSEAWSCRSTINGNYNYQRDFITYKLINKFDKSEKIKKVYIS